MSEHHQEEARQIFSKALHALERGEFPQLSHAQVMKSIAICREHLQRLQSDN